MGESVLAVVDGQSSRFRASAGGRLRKRLPVGFICLLVFSSVLYSDYIPSVRAATSTSWNPKVQCTPLIVRITDITANQTGSGSFSTSPFTPGITTTVAGGLAKRWLTPGPTPPGWVTPGPPCTVTNSRGTTSVFVEIDGIERGSIATEDSAGSYDSTNGGTSHPTTYDTTFNIFDPSFVSSYSSSCSSSTDKTCYGRMHAEIDHDWKAAGYCGSGTVCDESALASKTSSSSTKIDIQGFVSWDPGHLTEGWHSFNGWEIHPVTGWRLSGQQDFSLSANPSTVSFNAGTTSSFTVTVSSLNGFTGTVNLSTNVSPSSGLSAGCSPNAISGGSGTSTCSLNSSTPGSYTVQVTGTSGSLSHTVSVSVSVMQPPPPPDFAVSANPTSLSIVQGFSGSSTITVTSQNGFTGTVTLSITTNSTNLACSPSSGSITGGSGTFTLSCSGSVAGNYLSKVTGTSGTLSHATSVTYTITTPTHPDFSITIRPANITTYPGFSGLLSAVDVNTVNGFSGIVTLATTNQVGLSFSLFPSTIEFVNGSPTCGCESELLVATTSATPLGRYTVNVTGTSGSVTHWATMTLIVASSDFALSSEFASQSAPLGGVADTIITVNGVNGFYGSVNLTATSSSKAISCMFITATSTSANVTVSLPFGSASVDLSCDTLGPAGLYNATVIGMSGSLTHSILFSVTIMDFIISATPVSFQAGSSANSTITVTSLSGLSGPVSLTASTPTGLTAICPPSLTLSPGGTSSAQCKFTSTISGTYVATVTGSVGCPSCSSPDSHSTTVTVTVTSGLKPDFSLSTSSSSLTISQGSSGTSTVGLTSFNGFSGTLSLAVSVSPTGPSANVNPVTVTLVSSGTSSSTLNVTTGSAAPGTYSVNITATSGSIAHSASVTVTITSNAPSNYALVVSYEGFVYRYYQNGTLKVFGQPVTTQLRAVAWKPDGSYALIVGDSAVLIKYDGTRLTTIPTGLSTATIFLSVAWRPDGSYALIGTSAGVLLEYDGTSVTRITTPYNQYFRAIAWNPSGTLALIVGYSGQVFLFQSTGQISLLSSGTTVGLDAVAWNPSGAYALISGDGGVILRYDGTTFQALNTAGLYSSTLRVRFISWDPSGSQALLVGDSGLVLRYDGSRLSAMPVLTSSILYSVSWSAGTAYIVGGNGTILTYSGGTLKSLPFSSWSGYRGIAWKPS
ncbi:MAG TPA: hypothetical protein VF910_02265 [Candidatus Bathyarchaeia archaeon]